MQEIKRKPEQILNFFKKEYPILKDVNIRQPTKQKGQKYQGFALFHMQGEFMDKGKTRQKKIRPYGIILNRELAHANFVLLHQIAHCISPYVERKHKEEWVKVDHDRQFYDNFLTVINLACKAGLFDKKFDNADDLKRYDKCV